MVRQGLWSSEEYLALARAWLHASCDEIVGNDMTGAIFYTTLCERFRSHALNLGTEGDRYRAASRTDSAISSRWRTLAADVQTYESIDARSAGAPSGTGAHEWEIASNNRWLKEHHIVKERDRISELRRKGRPIPEARLYVNDPNAVFPLKAAWLLLHRSPKFNSTYLSQATAPSAAATHARLQPAEIPDGRDRSKRVRRQNQLLGKVTKKLTLIEKEHSKRTRFLKRAARHLKRKTDLDIIQAGLAPPRFIERFKATLEVSSSDESASASDSDADSSRGNALTGSLHGTEHLSIEGQLAAEGTILSDEDEPDRQPENEDDFFRVGEDGESGGETEGHVDVDPCDALIDGTAPCFGAFPKLVSASPAATPSLDLGIAVTGTAYSPVRTSQVIHALNKTVSGNQDHSSVVGTPSSAAIPPLGLTGTVCSLRVAYDVPHSYSQRTKITPLSWELPPVQRSPHSDSPVQSALSESHITSLTRSQQEIRYLHPLLRQSEILLCHRPYCMARSSPPNATSELPPYETLYLPQRHHWEE
jgi:hypothetical protein